MNALKRSACSHTQTLINNPITMNSPGSPIRGLLLAIMVATTLLVSSCGDSKPKIALPAISNDHGNSVTYAGFMDGSHIITVGKDGGKIWSLDSGKIEQRFGDGLSLLAPTMAPKSHMLAAATITDRVDGLMLWSLLDGKLLHDFRGTFPGATFSSVASFDPEEKRLAIGVTDGFNDEKDGELQIWNIAERKIERSFSSSPKVAGGEYHRFIWVGFSENGNKLIGVSASRTDRERSSRVLVWDVTSGVKIHDVANSRYTFYDAFLDESRGYLVTTSLLDACIWDLNSGQLLNPLRRRAATQAIIVSPKGDKCFSLADVTSLPQVATFPGQDTVYQFRDHPISCAWDSTGQRIVTGHGAEANPSAACDVVVRSASDGAAITRFCDHTRPVYYVAFSPDGKHVLGCDGLGHFAVWKTADTEDLKP